MDAAGFSRRELALPIYVPAFLVAAGLGAAIPATPLLARELGAGVAVAGLAVAMRGFGTMALDVPTGLLVARFPDRRVMLWGAVATACAAAATAAAADVIALVSLLFAAGAGLALWSMARLHFMAEQVPPALRGRAMATLGGTGRLGLFVGPALGGLVADRFGLESAFLAQGALTALGAAALAIGFARRPPPPAPAPGAAGGAPASATRMLARVVSQGWRELAGAGAVAVTLQVLRSARFLLVPLWGDAIGLDVAEIGLVLGLSSGLDMLLFHPAGLLLDRAGRRATGAASLLLLGAGLALLPLATGFTSLVAAGLLVGLGNGLSAGFVMTLGADLAPQPGRSQFLGVWRLIGDAGSAAGPLVAGALAQAATLAAASWASAGLGALGALLLLALVGETRRAPGDTARP